MNTCNLTGRLGHDPELTYTPNGVAVCTFSIAVDRPFKNEAGEKQTDWLDVVAWRQSAEFVANYLTKGSQVAVQGSIQIRSWVQNDGQKRSKAEIVADRVESIGGKKQEPTQGQEPAGSDEPEEYDPFDAFAGE